MKKIGLFWGSTTGNQEEASELLQQHIEESGYEVDSYDIRSTDLSKMLEYSNLIIGCPTWNVGELQEDWEEVFLEYRKILVLGRYFENLAPRWLLVDILKISQNGGVPCRHF